MLIKRKGFTLIELLVVISIIGLLSSIVLAGFTNIRKSARDARRYSDLQEINKAIQLYILANGHAPYLAAAGCGASGDGSESACWTSEVPSLIDWSVLEAELKPYMAVLPRDPCGVKCFVPGSSPAGKFYTYKYYAPAAMAYYCGAAIFSGPSCANTNTAYLIYAQNLETKTNSPYGFNSGSTGGLGSHP